MELENRLLRYFVTVAREGSMTRAAEELHVTQSNLSKQIKVLETQVGASLFRRSSCHLYLTESGRILLQYAEDILTLADRAQQAMDQQSMDVVAGDVYIGCGESPHIRFLAQAIRDVRKEHPQVCCHLVSGDTQMLSEDLQRGVLDFAVLWEAVDPRRYGFFPIPIADHYGVVMRKDDPLARKEAVNVGDLVGKSLIGGRQSIRVNYPAWFGAEMEHLQFAATFSLNYNSTLLVQAGLGYSLTFDGLSDTGEDSTLCFRPLSPPLVSYANVVWKLHHRLSPAAEAVRTAYLHHLQSVTQQSEESLFDEKRKKG